MDKVTVVEVHLEDGAALLDRLAEQSFEVVAAFWIRPPEGGEWELQIAPQPGSDVTSAYRAVSEALRQLPESSLSILDVKIVDADSPVTRDALRLRNRFRNGAVTHSRIRKLSNLEVEEIYVYPPSNNKFAELKRRFPSAELLTVPVEAKTIEGDVGMRTIAPLMGKINAEAFEGKPPQTVWFSGPEVSGASQLGQLVFFYRPEGWNKFLRLDTNTWEEVVGAGSGKRVYELADFGPLLALKSG